MTAVIRLILPGVLREKLFLSHCSGNQSNWLTGCGGVGGGFTAHTHAHTSARLPLCETSPSYQHCLSFPVWLHCNSENGNVSCFPLVFEAQMLIKQILPLVLGGLLTCFSQVRALSCRRQEREEEIAVCFTERKPTWIVPDAELIFYSCTWNQAGTALIQITHNELLVTDKSEWWGERRRVILSWKRVQFSAVL